MQSWSKGYSKTVIHKSGTSVLVRWCNHTTARAHVVRSTWWFWSLRERQTKKGTDSVLSPSMSAMFVSQFWCYMREHGFKRGRQGQRGVWVMQHETVLYHVCRTLPAGERRGRRGGKKGECSSEESQSLSPLFPGGTTVCAFPICLRCSMSVYMCICMCVCGCGWGFACGTTAL